MLSESFDDVHIGDYPNSILSNTDIPENGSYVTTAGIISLNFDNVESNEHYVRSGIQSVLSVEWAPAKMNTVGDYFLSSFLFESYLPLFDLEPTNEANSFSLNWANRIGLNYIDGTNIPIPTSYKNNFDVRGIESERYDTRFSAVNMTELRMGLPGILIDFLGIYQMIPSLLIYTDVGYFWESEQYNGIVMSHGAAIYLNMFNDAIQIGARLDYLSIGSKIDESKLTPVSLMFGYCY